MSRSRRRPWVRGERGAGLIGAIAGVTVFLAFLTVALQILLDLYTTSVVTSATYDAARLVATGTPEGQAQDHAEGLLGGLADEASFDWGLSDSEVVRVHVVVPTQHFLLPVVSGVLGLDDVDRVITVRRERTMTVATRTGRRRWHRDERGQMGGIEALPFGLLIFVVGALLIANAWAVIDAKLAVTAAAREGARTLVESDDPEVGLAAARDAAEEALEGHGRDADRMTFHPDAPDGFGRCAVVVVEVGYTVPAVPLPWIGGFGSGITVTARHAERVDPFRDGIEGEAAC